jgi:hypothetical protein
LVDGSPEQIAGQPGGERHVRALWIEDHQLIAESLEVFLQVQWPEISLDRSRDITTAIQLVKNIPYHVRAILQIVGVHKRGEAVFQARARGGGA